MRILTFVSTRLLTMVLVSLALVTIVFFLSRVFVNPAAIMLPPSASAEDVQRLNESLGLSRPLIEQYASYVGGILRGDFGTSYWQHTATLPIVLERFPATMILAVGSIIIAVLVGLPLGLVAGWRPGSIVDKIVTAFSGVAVSVPEFWFGLILIITFAVTLQVLPAAGFGEVQNAILPILALSLRPAGRMARLAREGTRSEVSQHYVFVARARGLPEFAIIRRHVIKNILPLLLQLLSIDFLVVFTGHAIGVETVFGWPGLSNLAINATLNQDLTLLTTIVVFTGALIAVVNMIVEIVRQFLDPRLRAVTR